MNPLKTIEKLRSVLAILRPFLFAIIGGLTVTTVNRCSEQKPVNLIVTNQAYETQIKTLQRNQDSLRNVLPSIDESLRYLSKRYPASNTEPIDR